MQQPEALVPGVVEPDLVGARGDEEVTVAGVCATEHLLVVVGDLENGDTVIEILVVILFLPFCNCEATVLSWTGCFFVPEQNAMNCTILTVLLDHTPLHSVHLVLGLEEACGMSLYFVSAY